MRTFDTLSILFSVFYQYENSIETLNQKNVTKEFI